MRKYRFFFTIHGNPDDQRGNPLPKAKLTARQQWTEKARRYVAWKDHVITAFLEHAESVRPDLAEAAKMQLFLKGKPIPSSREKIHMEVFCRYKNHKHPDTENVFGSIADALFQNDSNLSGEFDFSVGDKNYGETIVAITVNESVFDV